jgi:hypothetical protein
VTGIDFFANGFLVKNHETVLFFYESEKRKNCILEGISNAEIQFPGKELMNMRCASGFIAS